MIIGIGVDLVLLKRIQENVEGVAKRVLSVKEYELYQTLTLPKHQAEFVAGRFAAKEALFKAKKEQFDFQQMSFLTKKDGSPYLDGDERVHISISHDGDYVVAFIVIEE